MKLRLFTGITPTASLTLGNYCGIIDYLLKNQDKYEIIIMIADLHALTIPRKDFDYFKQSEEIINLLYSCGLKKIAKFLFNHKFLNI